VDYIVIFALAGAFLKLALDIIAYNKLGVLSLKTISQKISKSYGDIKDSPVNTVSLFKKRGRYTSPVAKIIIDRLLSETVKKIENIPGRTLSLKSAGLRAVVLICILSASYLGFVKSGFYRESLNLMKASFFLDRDNYMEVFPGNIISPAGKDINIKVKTNMTRPELYIERLEETFVRQMTEISPENYPENYSYTVYDLKEDANYRIKTAEGYKTDRYYVRILLPPELTDISLTYYYPEYTRLAAETVSGGNIRAYRGTAADLTVTADKPLKDATVRINGKSRQMEKKSNRKYKTSILVNESGQYKIFLAGKISEQSSEQISVVNNNLPLYRIEALKDSPPEITLVYPDKDIKASPDAKIEIAGRARDNLGIKSIKISYYIDVGGKSMEVSLKEFEAPVKENNFSYIWDLAKTNVVPGSIITYQLTASDSNTLYGPGIGLSRRRRIEIEGFRERHKKILKDMSDYQNKLLDMVEKSYDMTSKLKNEDYPSAGRESKELEDTLKDMIEKAASISKEMEKDSFTEESTRREFKGIEDILKNILKYKMQSLKESMSAENKDTSLETSENIESELEKAAKLTEDISKRENMSDISSSAEDTMNSARELSDMLAGGEAAPEDIMDKIRKLAELMNEMRKAIKDMPHQLPDEFINKESMQDIDFNASQNSLKELSEALKAKDYNRAREILKELSESLEAMAGQIQKAAGESYGSRKDMLAERTRDLTNKLKEIIQKQGEIIEDTDILKDYQIAKKAEWDKKRFEMLKKKYREFKSTAGFRSSEADSEFSKGRLFQTPGILKNYMENSKDKFKRKKTEEFLKELKERPDPADIIDADKKKELKSLSQRQQTLKSETENIRNGLDTLSHMSAVFDPEILENISFAVVYMGKASQELTGYMPLDAVGSGRRALAYLSMSENKMEDFSKQMQSMPKSLSSGQSGLHKRPSGGQAGRRGFKEGYVEIPGAAEARGGEEIREKILKELKEKYPERYRKLIREYFKSLTK
jgi:hypothetical protein